MYTMEKRHVQAELSAAEYEAVRRAAAAEGVPIKEALREAARAWAAARTFRDDPFFKIIGIASTGTSKGSRDHDEIYDED